MSTSCHRVPCTPLPSTATGRLLSGPTSSVDVVDFTVRPDRKNDSGNTCQTYVTTVVPNAPTALSCRVTVPQPRNHQPFYFPRRRHPQPRLLPPAENTPRAIVVCSIALVSFGDRRGLGPQDTHEAGTFFVMLGLPL